MNRSLLLSVATRFLSPLMILFSVFLLLRGHNEPGGGFLGGLVAIAAMMLTAIAQGPATLRRLLPLQPLQILAVGLLVATSSACIPLLFGLPLMNALWLSREIPVLGKVGTPVLFDLGVYLTVIGVMLLIFLSLAED